MYYNHFLHALTRILVACLLCFPFTQVHAALPYSKIVFFGDSLSDNGNLYSVLDGYMPKSPPYYQGQFTNGEVWTTQVAIHFASQGITASNYAVGGETAVLHNPADGYLPFTITASVYDYLLRTLYQDRSDTLYIIWIGANDYIPGVTDPDQLTSHVISNIQYAIDTLIYHGGKHFIILTLPDVSKTPHSVENHMEKQLANVVNLHNQKLATMISYLQQSYSEVDIRLLDVQPMMASMITNHLFKNITSSCWQGTYSLTNQAHSTALQDDFNAYLSSHQSRILTLTSHTPLTAKGLNQFPDYANHNPALFETFRVTKLAEAGNRPCDNPDDYLFWDHIHPTRQVHAFLAEQIIRFIQEEQKQVA